jgi:Ser/Thr protein kinase RdoA (MazF antagonist)
VTTLRERVQQVAGAVDATAVAGGFQSHVFELAFADGRHAVAKVLDASLIAAAEVLCRVELVAELAASDPRVCAPLSINGRLVNEVVGDGGADALLICFEFADGVAPDERDPSDAELMGSTLAGLHQSLARLAPRSLPRVAALRSNSLDAADDMQLLHGDFNSANLRCNGSAVKVFDFEDCGYGPRLFDLANALYMVLFSATVEDDIDRYRAFAPAFTSGYARGWGGPIDRLQVSRYIDLRVGALAGWVSDLNTAPIGIRTATPQWHATLRSFVTQYESGRF